MLISPSDRSASSISLISALCLPLSAIAAQPDIILMMGDDHGWEETGYNGHPHVKTPVLDEMAATGLKFERFYAYPSCSPTRASFLTGRDPNRMGVFSPGWSLRPEEITIAHLLSKAGYHCAHLGKWHVGAIKEGSPVNPGAMGFHEWLSHDNFFEMNPPFSRNGGPPEVFEGESSEILIRESIAAIGRAREAGKPAFLVIWFGSPHEPYSGLPQDLALYDDLPAELKPYIDPELQKGTTPLVKLAGGKATRDFRNFHHPPITEADYHGARSFIDGDHKLVIHEKGGGQSVELFDLKNDPAEKSNLAEEKSELAEKLQADLRKWQDSVLHNLTGADYR